MSRTPETITNKKAESLQGKLYVSGLTSGLFSYGAFSGNNDSLGFWLAVLCIFLIFVGSKIKTTYQKSWEVGGYK